MKSCPTCSFSVRLAARRPQPDAGVADRVGVPDFAEVDGETVGFVGRDDAVEPVGRGCEGLVEAGDDWRVSVGAVLDDVDGLLQPVPPVSTSAATAATRDSELRGRRSIDISPHFSNWA
ncbi:hypothetical protein GCM10009841_27620 [Microlunatus panaciterrae]|uniref:Uncharacterized protein n=1 Tax=Microlunatus panaciterrae TaxID=400768 RepID=A0ABS2RH69_9ACTN|nr:hypothetical protein [Microlunatus panaciterrae]MBM7798354.1 hypothetical protein [Microlunatus panaciterrae]